MFMHDHQGHDHSHMTHSAKCDHPGCGYVAETHTHDDDTAVANLAQSLADHNKQEHGKATSAEDIKDAVKAKMQHS
jgi:predicted small metal-binding protein